MDAYKMAVANVAAFIRSRENSCARVGAGGLDAYTAAHVLGKAFCKSNCEVLADLVNVELADLISRAT